MCFANEMEVFRDEIISSLKDTDKNKQYIQGQISSLSKSKKNILFKSIKF